MVIKTCLLGGRAADELVADGSYFYVVSVSNQCRRVCRAGYNHKTKDGITIKQKMKSRHRATFRETGYKDMSVESRAADELVADDFYFYAVSVSNLCRTR